MNMTIRFPDTIAQELGELPDRDTFVSHAVAEALRRRPVDRSATADAESKWTRIVRRVDADTEQLGDYYPKFKSDMREFRESFHFRHDELE